MRARSYLATVDATIVNNSPFIAISYVSVKSVLPWTIAETSLGQQTRVFSDDVKRRTALYRPTLLHTSTDYRLLCR